MAAARLAEKAAHASDVRGNHVKVTINGGQIIVESLRHGDAFGITQYVDGVDFGLLLECFQELSKPWEGK